MKVNLQPEFALPKDILSKSRAKSTTFEEHLQSVTRTHITLKLNEELAAIQEQGRRLVKNMSLADLKRYRDMVAGFLKLCISMGLNYKEERFSSRYGRIKVLSVVEIVNQKLMALAEALLSENNESLKVLSLVDEIRGLLLDLYV